MIRDPQQSGDKAERQQPLAVPAITLPKGGGAIRGMGEKFAANPVTGTGSLSVPIATSPGRSGFGPQLALSYDSGAGNGPFGFGWNLSLPAITRKTDKGLPQYLDGQESDVFILSGAEDLVPVYRQDADGTWVAGHPGYQRDPDGFWVCDPSGCLVVHEDELDGYRVRRYRPRIEGLFARIERWTGADGDVHWRSLSKDNILTIYGQDENSRIADPEDAGRRIFSWLIRETRDDKGNAVIYRYQAEDGTGVDLAQANERNRTRTANRYLKQIFYGNRAPLLDDAGHRPHALTPAQLDEAGWMFEVVFDYGEHAAVDPKPNDSGDWPYRLDPFSSYRAGFEVRTYRLCRRVLMFHHFSDEAGVGQNCLVRSTAFDYRETPIAAFITAVTQSGYQRADGGGYLRQSLPPLEFAYSQPVIGQDIHVVDAASMENLPAGVDGAAYQWVDLDGEGLSGVLTEQGSGWFYKRNESALAADRVTLGDTARFSPVETVARIPNGSPLARGAQFLDLAGDGQVDVVELDRPVAGFYERTDERDWEPFRPFTSLPNLAWNDPNLKFVDLTGDGHADVLITEDWALTWYPSLAEDGFGPANRVGVPTDEERGPRVVFADGTQTIFLADLSGDGLTDLARIRNGEVCYWPNLGYGRFGAKVTMDDAPWFDAPDQFDPRRIRLADIDGSGTTDLIYLGRNQTRCWFNQCGNRWGIANELPGFPPVDNVVSVAAVDLLGNGTACLVWSSPLPGTSRAPMKYLKLMAEGKPHLLIGTRNNLGAETRVHYVPSTYFYLRDQAEGRPWITKLPFPVHVVERVETCDHISRNRFVTRYAYHHGYFDGVEREFRGFGMVEQWDTEEFAALGDPDSLGPCGGEGVIATNIDAASHVPPVHTKTWFHTGVYVGRDHVSDFFAGLLDAQDEGEYYREPGLTDQEAANLGLDDEARRLYDDARAKDRLLDDTVLPHGLSLEEEREACRALKGSMLRQEVYALDGTEKEEHPYTVTEQNFTIRCVQPQQGNRHAVFFTHPREAITYHYERNPADPRVQNALTLEVDEFGNVLKEVAIGYGRRNAEAALPTDDDRAKQTQSLIIYTENRLAMDRITGGAIDTANDYRTPLPCETRTYELTGFKPENDAVRFSFDEWTRDDFALPESAVEIPYEQVANKVSKQKRLIEHVRTLYRRDDLTGFLPLGEMESLALPGESYKLAFTPGLLDQVYVRDGQNLLPVAPADVLAGGEADCGGYVDLDGNGHWWIPTGRVFHSPNGNDTAAQELAEAQAHFFLPRRYRDPFGQHSFVDFDDHDLLMVETRDALGNRVTVEANDYRVLQPRLVSDPNRNQTAVAFDALGMVVGTAVTGKPGENLGDSLDGFVADLDEAVIRDHLTHPLADPHAILGRATSRLVYDLFAYQRTRDTDDPQPAVAYTLARETHDADLEPGQRTKVQHSFSYSDGFGREIQQKIQAEPGPLVKDGPVVSPRWVGSGWTIFNNKGKPVRQYEPFFSATHGFEFGVRVGVSPILFYDPVERVIATLHPNHTYEKVVFDPWRQTTHDVNDTVLGDPRIDPDVAGYVREYFKTQPGDWEPWHAQRQDGALGAWEQAAASKAAAHADTATTAHFDTLGRPFLTLAHNGFNPDGTPIQYATRVELDIEGNQRAVRDAIVQDGDAQGRIVMRYDYDLLGNRIHQASIEAGERWMLNDVTSKPIRTWDSRGFQRRMTYDELRRPTGLYVTENGAERLAERTVYGEGQGEIANHRTRVHQVFDGAGIVTSVAYDFKGNLLEGRRELLPDYKSPVNWLLNPSANDGSFTSTTSYDALNRPVTLTTPHTSTMPPSVIHPSFNEANLLDKVDVNLRGATTATPFVTNIDYNEKGQRKRIVYGNGAQTTYDYDSLTFRLTKLETTRPANPDATASRLLQNAAVVQDLRYTYDPVGNITRIEDAALQIVFHAGQQVDPVSEYTYDALYRLIEARGREHIGQSAFDFDPPNGNCRDYPFVGHQAHPNDLQALRNYIERYEYDAVGNFERMHHHLTNGGGWVRHYDYEENSLIEPTTKKSNRLTQTTLGNGLNHTETYAYTDAQGNDVHGCMTAINRMGMVWDFEDQLQQVNLGGGGTAYYVYDAGGQRVRKVIESQDGRRVKERLYLGGFEIYREFYPRGTSVRLERESLHVMGDKQRIALVETQTLKNGNPVGTPEPVQRYQFGNHLGSASVELDEDGALVSYEEYHPYGTTAFQVRGAAEVSLKRYRYTGKERDEESGLYYHEARYYAAWLARWVSCDPSGLLDGVNPCTYVKCNPIRLRDPSGRNSFEDLAQFIRNQAGFEQGARNPPTIDLTSARANASPFGTAAHGTATGVVQEMQKIGFINASRVVSEPVIVNGVIISAGSGPAGAPKGALVPDLLYTNQGVQGSVVGQQASVVTQELADIKYGGGQAAAKYSQVGVPVRTVNSVTNSAATDPSLLHMAAPEKPPSTSPVADIAATESAVEASITSKAGLGSKVAKGLGVAGAVVGSAVGGYQVGKGINKMFEGKAGEGAVDVGEGTANLGLTIGVAVAVKAKVVVVEVGAAAGGVAALAGVAAAGSVTLAAETARAAVRGEETPLEVADKFYGTQFSDIYTWQKRSTAARVGFAVATMGLSEGWYALNKLVE